VTEADAGWQESASQLFIDYGDAFTPSRSEQADLIVSLVPAVPDEEFVAVDLACGAGWLSEAVLRRFARAQVIALDGSPAMLERAAATLAGWMDHVELREFDLRDRDWLADLPSDTRCFVSSLAIHHLDGAEKRDLFKRLAEKLVPGGALLIADLVEPLDDAGRRAYALAWDAAVKEQSERRRGDLSDFEEFRRQEWNLFEFPDPDIDKPSNLFEQLSWLREAGFSRVDCFWLRAGHAIYGGYV
jgi:trans-aconitate methyltransferase